MLLPRQFYLKHLDKNIQWSLKFRSIGKHLTCFNAVKLVNKIWVSIKTNLKIKKEIYLNTSLGNFILQDIIIFYDYFQNHLFLGLSMTFSLYFTFLNRPRNILYHNISIMYDIILL